MKRFLLKILGYGFLVLCCFNSIAFMSLYVLGNSSFYKPSFVTNYKQQNFDYVILGSSTGLTTLDTNTIDSITGFSGLNASVDDTSLGSHFLMLKHFIESGKQSKRCILTINYGDVANENPSLSGNDYRFLPYINKTYIYDYYKEYNNKEATFLRQSKYLPFLGVGYYNAEIFYPSLLSLNSPERRNRFDDKGNYVYPSQEKILNKDLGSRVISLSIKNPYFEKIKNLCAKEKIKLILYQPPIYDRTVTGIIDKETLINHSSLFAEASFFYDRIHVNGKGRTRASKVLAKQLKSL